MTDILTPGLYVTATPIGCLEDITLRALRVLRTCNQIICEDTRVSFKLLKFYHIQKPLITYQDHNADKVRPQIIRHLQDGLSLALISDAGMPLIADPGFKLVRDCQKLGIKVTVIPGPTAFVSAAILSGFSTHALTFLGFASRLKNKTLKIWENTDSTLIFFEAPHKLLEILNKLKEYFSNRQVSIIKEMTKIHEEVIQGTFEDIIQYFSKQEPRGEFVIALSPPAANSCDFQSLSNKLKDAMRVMSLKDAVAYVAKESCLPKNDIYRKALDFLNK